MQSLCIPDRIQGKVKFIKFHVGQHFSSVTSCSGFVKWQLWNSLLWPIIKAGRVKQIYFLKF